MNGYFSTNSDPKLKRKDGTIRINVKVGNTYQLDSKEKNKLSGFLFYEKFLDFVFSDLYKINNIYTKVYEIEILGSIETRLDCVKHWTNKIRIIRQIQSSEYPKLTDNRFDKNGDEYEIKQRNGTSYLFKYDEHHNMIFKHNPNGSWVEYTYDKNGNIIREENSDKLVIKNNCDADGNVIYSETCLLKNENKNQPESINYYKYDQYGNCIYHKKNNIVMLGIIITDKDYPLYY